MVQKSIHVRPDDSGHERTYRTCRLKKTKKKSKRLQILGTYIAGGEKVSCCWSRDAELIFASRTCREKKYDNHSLFTCQVSRAIFFFFRKKNTCADKLIQDTAKKITDWSLHVTNMKLFVWSTRGFPIGFVWSVRTPYSCAASATSFMMFSSTNGRTASWIITISGLMSSEKKKTNHWAKFYVSILKRLLVSAHSDSHDYPQWQFQFETHEKSSIWSHCKWTDVWTLQPQQWEISGGGIDWWVLAWIPLCPWTPRPPLGWSTASWREPKFSRCAVDLYHFTKHQKRQKATGEWLR